MVNKPMTIPDDVLLKIWNEIKDEAKYGSIATPLKKGIFLYFLNHKSVNALEVYVLNSEQVNNTYAGETPTSYLAYACIELGA